MKRVWIRGIAAGDQKSFLDFYNRVAASFVKFLYYRTGNDMDLALEVCQEAFTRMIDHREELRGLRSDEVLYPWLCGVAKRILAGYYKAKVRRRRISIESVDPIVGTALIRFDTEDMPDEAATHAQMQQLVGAALNGLKPGYAELLRLKYQKGWSVQQIAERTGRSPKVIEGRLFRAREAFREVFHRAWKQAEVVHVE